MIQSHVVCMKKAVTLHGKEILFLQSVFLILLENL